jgi:phosphoglycolate phosphatase
MKKLFIFDLDGTIIDSRRATQKIINCYCKKNNLSQIDASNILVSSSKRIIKEWNYLSDNEYRKNLYNIYCEIDNNLGNGNFMPKIFKNFQYILEELKQNDNTLALYTSNSRIATEKILVYHKIKKYFTNIKTWEDCEELNIKPKPDPIMLNFINRDLNFEKKFIYYIGDTSKDILFAKNANINSVFVNWGYGELLNDIKSDFVVNHIYDLLLL